MTFPPMELAHLIYFVSGFAVGVGVTGIVALMAGRA